MALPVHWQFDTRKLLDGANRCAYLDFLSEMGEGQRRFADLDLNLDRFLQTSRYASAPLLRATKEAEALTETWRQAFVLDAAGLASGKPLELLTGIAQSNGYRRLSAAGDKGVREFKRIDCPDLGSVRLIELEALKRQGDVVVGYRFPQGGGRGIGLGNIVPGGVYYSQWNTGNLQIAHSFCAQLHLFSILASLQ